MSSADCTHRQKKRPERRIVLVQTLDDVSFKLWSVDKMYVDVVLLVVELYEFMKKIVVGEGVRCEVFVLV